MQELIFSEKGKTMPKNDKKDREKGTNEQEIAKTSQIF